MKNLKLYKSVALLTFSTIVLVGCKNNKTDINKYLNNINDEYEVEIDDKLYDVKKVNIKDLKQNIKELDTYEVYFEHGDIEPNDINFYFETDKYDIISIEYIYDDDKEYAINEINDIKKIKTHVLK